MLLTPVGFNPSYSGCWFGRQYQSLLKTMPMRFNPSYSGCWFGRAQDCKRGQKPIRVSILLILDVDSEAFFPVGRNVRAAKVSILLILDVDSEVFAIIWITKLIIGFNPSYSGCWFGSGFATCRSSTFFMFQSFLFWMLIRKISA